MRLANLDYMWWRARQCARYAKTARPPEAAKLLTELARDLEEFAAAAERRLDQAQAAASVAELTRGRD